MNDNWQTGDLALCIHEGDWSPSGVPRAPNECPSIITALAPRKGTIWKVSFVETVHRDEWIEGTVTFLHLEGQPSPYCYNSQMFMKFTGNEDAEACEHSAEKVEA